MTDLHDRRVLITGGTGFLGLALAERFLKSQWQVTLFDRIPLTGSSLSGYEVQTIVGDVRDLSSLEKAIQHQEVVIHAAAALPIQGSKKIIWDINVDGTQNVLMSARKMGVEKVIYISSTAVYGVPKSPVEEDFPKDPIGSYGVSKYASEKICEEFRRQGYPVVIIRPKTFLGSGRLGIFQILFEWIYQGSLIYILGNGKNHYQLLALSDLVEAIWLSANIPGFSETLNIGAEKFSTVEEELKQLITIANSHSSLFPLPSAPINGVLKALEFLRLSPLVEWHYKTASKDSYVSIEKAKKFLNWSPQKSNLDALVESYHGYCQNREQYSSRKGTTHTTSWDLGVLRLFQIPAEWLKWGKK